MSASQLSIVSEDFTIVEYLVQLQLKAPQLRLKEVSDIGNDAIKEKFAAYVAKMPASNIVDVFLRLDAIQQPVSDIINHGIRVNPQVGLKFRTNGFQLGEMEDGYYEVLHLVIALGQIFNFEIPGCDVKDIQFSNTQPTPADLPSRCDSLRVSANNDFVIFNQNQIKACHLVKFAGGDNISSEPPVFTKCAVCGCDNATLWCENDCIKLCEECDKKTHTGNPVFEKHTRVPLTESHADFQTCPLHPGNRVQYYCKKCHAPVCLECKIHGTHAKGECSRHKLIAVADAFNQTRQALQTPSSTFNKRERQIKERQLKVQGRLDELASAEEELIKKIKVAAEEAIQEAHRLYSEKAVMLHSALTELDRKNSEIVGMEEMIATHRDCSEPLDLLQADYASSQLLNEVKDPSDLPLPPENYGEIVIKQNIVIGIDENVKSAILERDHKLNESGTGFTESTVASESKPKKSKDPTLGTVMATREARHITSLARMAARKKEKYARQGIELDFLPFEHSSILKDENLMHELYLCFPFKATPMTKLLYSSERDGRSVEVLHKCVDGTGITAVLVKVGENVFGGFAASKWNSDGRPFGQGTSSFLFSLTKDAFIPYRPLPDEPICLYADKDTLTFGKYDLKLVGDLDRCTSSIENNFGVGFEYGSDESKNYLAGSPVFKADIVEVWGFFSDGK